MVDEQGQLVATMADQGAWGAGTVIGALPRADNDECDIEVVVVRVVDDGGYLLRHASMSRKELTQRREFLHVIGDPPKWSHTDTVAADLSDVASLTAGIRSRAVAVQLPGVQPWKRLGGPFEQQLEKYRLREQVPWLPKESSWHRRARQALSWGWAAVLVSLIIFGAGAEVMQGEDDQSVGNLLLGGLITFGVIGALILVGLGIAWVRRRYRGEHEETATEPGDSANLE